MAHNMVSNYKNVYSSIIDLIGNTPIVRLGNIIETEGLQCDILAKLEFFNPLSSVKDRIGFSMIEALEKAGKINEDTILIEPTSGNTGIALAFICAAKNTKLVLTMPDSMSIERRKMLKHFGADIVLTPAAKGMRGAVEEAEKIASNNPNAIIPQQFENPANPDIHYKTTAEEIWRDTGGKIDAFVLGVGTGGTLSGVSKYLKEKNKDIKVVAVEPEDSPVLSGRQPGPHKIQGIGAGFVPGILDVELIDEVITVGNEPAFDMARKVASIDGIPCGISSGAALAASIELGKRDEMKGKSIVAIFPSMAERYLTTELFDGTS